MGGRFLDRIWKIKDGLRNVRPGFDIPPAFEFKNVAFCPLDDAFFQSIQDRSTAHNLLLVDIADEPSRATAGEPARATAGEPARATARVPASPLHHPRPYNVGACSPTLQDDRKGPRTSSP